MTVLLFLAAGWAVAQGGSISGSVVLPSGAYLNEPAKITLLTDRGVKSNVYTDNRGHFQFNGLTPSIYEIVVEPTDDRFEVAKATVEVFPNSPAHLNINLKEKKTAESHIAKTVSTGELDSAVPEEAKKEFDRASEASRAGKTNEAIQHLRTAIGLYPEYLMAHNDLGIQLLSQAKLDEAAEEFRVAIRLDPKAFNPRLNLAIVLVQQRTFSEAVEMLRIALAQQPLSPAANLYNGFALEGLDDLKGAERALTYAHDLGGSKYAIALFHLGRIYLNRGERERARKVLEAYLREAPDAPNTAEAKKLLAVLR